MMLLTSLITLSLNSYNNVNCLHFSDEEFVDIEKKIVPLSTEIVKVINMLNEMEIFAKRLR